MSSIREVVEEINRAEQQALAPLNDVGVEIRTLDISGQCTALVVSDQESYNTAVSVRESAKDFLREATKYWDEVREPAYRAYQAVLDKQNAVLPKIKAAIKQLDDKIVGYTLRMRQEQERLRIAAEEAARQKAQDEKLEQAAEAEAAGYDEESVQAILDAPVESVAVTESVPVVFEKSEAVQNLRDNWSGEVTDKLALMKYVIKNKNLLNLFDVNQTALNNQIKISKADTDIPGVKAVNKPMLASTRRSR